MARSKRTTLPNWYPLAIYQQTLSPDEWHTEIALRAALKSIDTNRRNGTIVERPEEILESFQAMFVTRTARSGGSLAQARHEDFFPVRALPPSELFFLSEHLLHQGDDAMQSAHDEAKALAKGGPRRLLESGELVRSNCEWPKPKAELDVTHFMDVFGKRTAVSVDLDCDDETLRFAFNVWLAGARSSLAAAPRPIGEREFTRWTKYQLLPAFDLLFWSELSGARLTDAFIAHTVWPDTGEEFVDLTERFRKVTRPMIADVFCCDFMMRFWRQLELERSLAGVVARARSDAA